jgi:hypothetical protein
VTNADDSDPTLIVIFGDDDPEDEYDDTDPFRVRLAILERVLEALRDRKDERFFGRRDEALKLIAAMIREHQEDTVRLERIQSALEALS